MSVSDTGDRLFVVFVDSLAPQDLAHMPFTREHLYQGDMDAGVPYVTPKVLGEIYTGQNPAENGMPAVSRYDTPNRFRPEGATLPELAAASDDHERVCNFGLPFIVPPMDEVATEDYFHASTAMNQQSFSPEAAVRALSVPGPAGDIAAVNHPDKEEDPDILFDLHIDYTISLFGQARTVAEGHDFDVVFISYRLLDSYCHYNYLGRPDDEDDRTYRERLAALVDSEIEQLLPRGDVFLFSDHGARDLTDVFRINHWLRDEGFLNVRVDEEWINKAADYGVLEDVAGVDELETLPVGQAGVQVAEEESTAICADPFSSGLTLLDGATDESVAALIDRLEATDAITAVHRTADRWEGAHADECPDLYPERAPGVFVSGNLTQEPGGPEITRDGVHSRTGVFGATTDLASPDEVSPIELHQLIREWLSLDGVEIDAGAAVSEDGRAEAGEAARERLEDLGYI